MPRPGSRLFVDSRLADDELKLEERTAHYAGHVLRLTVGDDVIVFNGRGTERRATIDRLTRRECRLRLHETVEILPASPAAITLVQGLIKPDRMDLIVQKSTELGVRGIVVAKTDFSGVKLDAARAERKLVHWQRVAESACEQSGRHEPPTIEFHRSLADALAARPQDEICVAFDKAVEPTAGEPDRAVASLALIVGPEGGFSPAETAQLAAANCRFMRLGRRVLRAETAAIVACGIAQMRWGDLS